MRLVNEQDKQFVNSLMRRFNIKGIKLAVSDSTKKWPDIWISDLDSDIPTVTVTREWARQSMRERHKRLVHEIVCHYVKRMDHDEKIGFSTYPERDRYSKRVYGNLVENTLYKINPKRKYWYHGTNAKSALKILSEGLKSGLKSHNRIFLSTTPEYAFQFGPVILKVKYEGEYTWTKDIGYEVSVTSDFIPAKDIKIYKIYEKGGKFSEPGNVSEGFMSNFPRSSIDNDIPLMMQNPERDNPFRILGYSQSNEPKLAVKIDVWYDRHSKSWVVQKKDRNDNQIGDADYVYSKREALQLKKDYGFKNPVDIESYVHSFRKPYEYSYNKLKGMFPNYSVEGRIKSLSSITEKLGRRNKSIYELTDIAGVRIIFDRLADLYQALSDIRQNFKVTEEENYIDYPKGYYRGYHLLIDVMGKPVEVQLKTRRMLDLSERMHDVIYKGSEKIVQQYGSHYIPQIQSHAKSISDYYFAKDVGQQPERPKDPDFWGKLKLPMFLLNPRTDGPYTVHIRTHIAGPATVDHYEGENFMKYLSNSINFAKNITTNYTNTIVLDRFGRVRAWFFKPLDGKVEGIVFKFPQTADKGRIADFELGKYIKEKI